LSPYTCGGNPASASRAVRRDSFSIFLTFVLKSFQVVSFISNLSLLVNQEAASIEAVSDLSKLELLSLRLPELVCSPLSINSLREDLQVAHKTVTRWLNILENIYMIYRLPPFGSPLIRAVKKEQKHYHFDWTLVSDMSARYENLLASHLLKWVHYRRDIYGEEIELRYFRDTDKREVDFCVLEDLKPKMFIESKWGDSSTSPHLHYLQKKFPESEYYQVSAIGGKHFINKNGIKHLPALEFLQQLV
jgi:predicted AAA+ superfamily ATPase